MEVTVRIILSGDRYQSPFLGITAVENVLGRTARTAAGCPAGVAPLTKLTVALLLLPPCRVRANVPRWPTRCFRNSAKVPSSICVAASTRPPELDGIARGAAVEG